MSIPAAHPLWTRIHSSKLRNEEKYQIYDLLVQDRGTHRWLCAHTEYVKKCQINFETSDFSNYTLHLHRTAKVIKPSDLNKKDTATFKRNNFSAEFQFEISHDLALIINALSKGKKTIKEALESLNVDPKSQSELINKLTPEIKTLYERGHIYVLLPEEK
jgi:hypothetical protein